MTSECVSVCCVGCNLLKLTSWGTSQRMSDTAQIDDDGLDAVAFAFDLGLNLLHLVAVEGIRIVLIRLVSCS